VVPGRGTAFFKAPSKESEVIRQPRPAEFFLGDPDMLAKQTPGWVRVFLPVEQQSGWITQIGWVRREEILAYQDFRRVSACWPVARMEIEIGDYWAELTFSTNGLVEIDSAVEKDRGRVYFADNIFAIRSIKRAPGKAYLHGSMNPDTGALDLASVVGLASHRMSTDQSLANCVRYPSTVSQTKK
jgi:hypothetical protein